MRVTEPGDVPPAQVLRGDILQAMGRSAESREEWDAVRKHLEQPPLSSHGPLNLRELGEVYQRLDMSCAGLRTEWEQRKIPVAWPVRACP